MIHGILFGNKKEIGSLYKQQSGEWKKPNNNAEWFHLYETLENANSDEKEQWLLRDGGEVRRDKGRDYKGAGGYFWRG